MRFGTILLFLMVALSEVFPYCYALYQQFEASPTTSRQLRVNGYLNIKLPWYQNKTVSSGSPISQYQATTTTNHEPEITPLPDSLLEVKFNHQEEGKEVNVDPIQDDNDGKICFLQNYNKFKSVCEVRLLPEWDEVRVDGTNTELKEVKHLSDDNPGYDMKQSDAGMTLPNDGPLADDGNPEESVDNSVESHNDKYDNFDEKEESNDFSNMSPHEREKTPPPPVASDIQTRFFEEYDKDGKFLHKYTDQELIELLHFLRDMRIGDDDHYTKEDAEIEEFTRKLFPDPNFDPSQYFNSHGDHVYEFDEEDWLDTPMWKLPPPRLSQADPRMFLGMCSDSHFRGICLRQYPIDGACYSVRNVMPEMDEHISSFKVDNGCCVFYKELNCRARNIVMSGKHSLVKELPGNTDDVVGSYRCAKTCEQVWEKELVDNAEL